MSSLALCGACLARGRRLAPLGAACAAHVTRYTEAGSMKLREVGARLPVCWECRALVDKSLLFRERVHRAQRTLAAAADQNQVSSISTLSSTVKLGFDFNFTSWETNQAACETNTGESGTAFKAVFFAPVKKELLSEDSNEEPEEVTEDPCKVAVDPKIELKLKCLTEELEEVTEDSDGVAEDLNGLLDIAEVKLEPSGLIFVTESKLAITECELRATAEHAVDKVPIATFSLKSVQNEAAVTGSFAKDSKVVLHVMDENELQGTREQLRSSEQYVKSLFKCKTCILGFSDSSLLEEHIENNHKPIDGENAVKNQPEPEPANNTPINLNPSISEIVKESISTLNSDVRTQPRKIKICVKKRAKNSCYYCYSPVLNFARHIERNHAAEIDVEKIMSMPSKSKQRKDLLTALRKKGNFMQNSSVGLKPMRYSKYTDKEDYLPCANCLGYYSRKQLWIHRKKCSKNPASGSTSAQSEGQNLLVNHSRIDPKLRDLVFPRMRVDKVSLTAKKDTLICALGAKQLKRYKEKPLVHVISRKMREMAKVLIEVRKLEPNIKNFLGALNPKYYNSIVTAVKNIARFNKEKDLYESPAFAMNISRLIKQCCHIALKKILKRKQHHSSIKTAEANIKTLIQLIDTNWKFDVGLQDAGTKITIITLAEDVKKIIQYVFAKAKAAASELKLNYSEEAYTSLMETIYCRLLLLNQILPGDLERLLLLTYTDFEGKNDKTVNCILSPTEKILVQSFKHIVMFGKGNRGVPVLFSSDVQEDLKLLCENRDTFVTKYNPFLFGKPKHKAPIACYKVFKKYVEACEVSNPHAVTSMRFHKHVATLTQIFNMSENDIGQLLNSMGLVTGVNKKSHSLPDNDKTVNMSKFLVLMEEGKALDDINANMDKGTMEEARIVHDYLDAPLVADGKLLPNGCRVEILQSKNPEAPHQLEETLLSRKRKLIPWTSQQKNVTLTFFKKHIKEKRAPRRHECEALIDQHTEVLHNKNWLKIKVFIQNTYKVQK